MCIRMYVLMYVHILVLVFLEMGVLMTCVRVFDILQTRGYALIVNTKKTKVLIQQTWIHLPQLIAIGCNIAFCFKMVKCQ